MSDSSPRRTIAFDTETHLIAAGRLAPPLVCLTYCERVGDPKIAVGADMARIFRAWLEDPAVFLVCHNLTFDLGVLAHHDPSLLPLIFDALASDRLGCSQLREVQRCTAHGYGRFGPDGKPTKYSLADCILRAFGETMVGKGGDAWRFRYHELDGVDLEDWPQEALIYALLDAEYHLRLWLDQCADEFGGEYLPAQIRAAWGLHLMSCWGVRTDPARVAKLELAIEAQINHTLDGMTPAQFEDSGLPESLREAAYDGLIKYGIYRPNRKKDTRVVKALVTKAYNDNPPLTDGDGVSTARDTLEASGAPELLLLASVGQVQQIKSHYLKHLVRGTTEVLNARFTVIKETSRTSCAKPNLQNPARKGGVRECFRPRLEDWVFIACDYHVAEMCALAQVLVESFGSSAMADAINDGRELHIETAAGILGWTYERALNAYRNGDPQAKHARQLAKVANFGFPGGLSSRGMVSYAAGFGVTIAQDEAEELKTAWLDRYPEMELYFAGVADMVAAGHGDYTYTDPVSGYTRGGIGFNDGCNHPFQHRVSVGAKAAAWAVNRAAYDKRLGSPLYGTRPWNFVHDEIIIAAHRSKAAAAAAELSKVMTRELQIVCPDVRITADAHIMDRWYKDAEPVCIDGQLAIWTENGPVAL
jgi:hypothetical protein